MYMYILLCYNGMRVTRGMTYDMIEICFTIHVQYMYVVQYLDTFTNFYCTLNFSCNYTKSKESMTDNS